MQLRATSVWRAVSRPRVVLCVCFVALVTGCVFCPPKHIEEAAARTPPARQQHIERRRSWFAHRHRASSAVRWRCVARSGSLRRRSHRFFRLMSFFPFRIASSRPPASRPARLARQLSGFCFFRAQSAVPASVAGGFVVGGGCCCSLSFAFLSHAPSSRRCERRRGGAMQEGAFCRDVVSTTWSAEGSPGYSS
jgi:hypothetical protein